MRNPHPPNTPLENAILIVDGAGALIWASKGAEDVLGTELQSTAQLLAAQYLKHSEAAKSGELPPRASGTRAVTFRDGRTLGWALAAAKTSPDRSLSTTVWTVAVNTEASSATGSLLAQSSAAKSFLESGSDGTFELSVHGHFLSASSAFAELCGYPTPESLVKALRNGQRFYVQRSHHGDLMHRLRSTGAANRFESAIYRRDGTTTWISQTVHAVRGQNGEVSHYIGTVQDIGWRKLAEEILNQAEEKWRAVVESSGECIVIADRAGMVFFANSRAQQLSIGLPGRSVFSAFSGASQQHLRTAIETAFRSMRAEVLDLEHAGLSGQRSWFEIRVVPIGNNETVPRVILIATDLTGKKKAEEAVREGQRLIGRVADASPAILYVYDYATENYVYVNHQVEKILGYTTEAFLEGGKSLSDSLVHAEDAGLLVERKRLLGEARDDGVVFEYTFRMRHAGGQWLWIRARDVVFTRGPDGRPAQIIGMAEDVTERRRAGQERERSREQLRALSARLQEAREEERAAISRRVHDELGQALTALSWELSRLSAQLENPAERQLEAKARLKSMTAMMESMMQIVRKVAAELRPPILDHFGLVAAIEWQAKEFQERYRITCEVAARGHHHNLDRAVSTAVFRIFQEILTNVARHSGATKVRVQFNDGARGFALIVHDNGRGITEGQKSQSLGILGMSERAHLFGGSIEIAGTAGKGTTVTVHIPKSTDSTRPEPRKETLRRSH